MSTKSRPSSTEQVTTGINPVQPTAESEQTPGHRTQAGRFSRRLRRPVFGLAAAACMLALGVGAASAAQAQVNPAAPHYVFPWGDCSVNVGSVATPNGAAVGGVDVTCNSTRGHITAYVYLYRDIGGSWVLVGSGGGTDYNNHGLYAWTAPPVCGYYTSYWDEVAVVNVDGSQHTFDMASGYGRYPSYAPTC